MKYLFLTLVVITSATIAGCKKMDDVKPIISIESPNQNDEFGKTESISFKATFTDDQELSQYKVDIHGVFDGHGHETLSDVEWNEIFTGDLSGTKQVVERSITVPENAKPGAYHFIVKCIDKAGNEATSEEIDITIK